MERQNEVQPAINIESRKTIDYPVEGNWDYVDFPMNEHLEEDSEPSTEFTFRSPEMKSIKLFLPGTLQRKTPLSLAIVLVIATFVYCLHVFGAFGEDTLVKEEMGLTLTTFKNFIWTSRIPVFVFFGFCYLKTYMDDVPMSFRLTSSKLKTLRVRILISCAFEVALTVVFPAIVRLVQLVWLQTPFEKKNHMFNTRTALINVTILAVARLLALPVSLNFIAEFYLLYYEIRQYNEDIQKWKQGQTEARNYFIDVHKKIKAAEKIFQLFLVIHLAILLLIFIPAMLSYVERFNAEGTVNKIFLKQQGEKMSDPIIVMDSGTLLTDNLSSSAYHLKMKSGQPILLMEVGSVSQGKNHSGTADQRDVAETRNKKEQDPKAQARIISAALVFTGELLALYLPIILLGKINNTFTRIAQTVRYGLKYDEQQEGDYLIQNDQVAKEMLKTLEHVEGVQILGMELTVVKSLLFAVFAPLLTLLIHIMIRDVDISP